MGIKSNRVVAAAVAAVGAVGVYFATKRKSPSRAVIAARSREQPIIEVPGTPIEVTRENSWLWLVGVLVLCMPLLLLCGKKKPVPPRPRFDVEAPRPRPAPRRRRASRLNFPKKLMRNVRRRSSARS